MKSLNPSILLLILGLLASDARAASEEELALERWVRGRVKPIPISLSGYSGEVATVLRFDLEVAGCAIVSEDQAQFLLKGTNNGQVEGRLSDAISKATRLAKAYSGGTPRSQAHALADDVIQELTGKPGIARTKIACRVARGPNFEIYVSDYDGHGAVAVTQDNTVAAAPAWVPGRRALFYTTYKFGNADIVSHDLGSGARQVVARHTGSNMSPAVSPDGRRVAMILSKGGSPDLYVGNLDGTGLQQLTRTPEDESSPCWSPDGRWIAFATKMNGRRVLAKIPTEGGQVQRIATSGVANPTEPDWSPDGRLIAFTAQMGNFEICVVPASGGEAQLLVGGQDPSWAPNSRTLIFTKRGRAGQRTLSLLDVPTRQNKDVAHNLGGCSQPSWAR